MHRNTKNSVIHPNFLRPYLDIFTWAIYLFIRKRVIGSTMITFYTPSSLFSRKPRCCIVFHSMKQWLFICTITCCYRDNLSNLLFCTMCLYNFYQRSFPKKVAKKVSTSTNKINIWKSANFLVLHNCKDFFLRYINRCLSRTISI